jgi:hypothetical protein
MMSEELTNTQIALLCDIQEHGGAPIPGDKRDDLQMLISRGYIEPSDPPEAALKLTTKGITFLAERGAGLNEA